MLATPDTHLFLQVLGLFCICVMMAISAARPQIEEGEYHTHTKPGDVAALCLIGGAPGRMEDMARKYLQDVKEFRNDHRGLLTFTGYYRGIRITLATSGMGVPSLGIVLPELIRSGARIFIRVGTCGSLIPNSQPGESIIISGARMWDGASILWVPFWKRWWYKLFGLKSNSEVTKALIEAAEAAGPLYRAHVGKQGTTSDFNTGQARPGLFDEIPWTMRLRHWFCMKTGLINCYSMEMAGLLAYLGFKAGGLPGGGVEGIVADRVDDEFADKETQAIAQDRAAYIALEAAVRLARCQALGKFLRGEYPRYSFLAKAA